jgi:pimeloyl-ACP methyl ester carboxylesterase
MLPAGWEDIISNGRGHQDGRQDKSFKSGIAIMRRQTKFFTFVIIILLLTLAYVWGYFADPGRYVMRFRATGYNGHFTENPASNFTQYVNNTYKFVKIARRIAHVDASDEVVGQNVPAILLPNPATCPLEENGKYENGILLVHGLLDSAYAMKVLGKYFQSKCFLVYVILLPGHGTAPGDLLHTTYNDWIAATDFATQKLIDKTNNVFLGGHSLGGLLAINEALLRHLP